MRSLWILKLFWANQKTCLAYRHSPIAHRPFPIAFRLSPLASTTFFEIAVYVCYSTSIQQHTSIIVEMWAANAFNKVERMLKQMSKPFARKRKHNHQSSLQEMNDAADLSILAVPLYSTSNVYQCRSWMYRLVIEVFKNARSNLISFRTIRFHNFKAYYEVSVGRLDADGCFWSLPL